MKTVINVLLLILAVVGLLGYLGKGMQFIVLCCLGYRILKEILDSIIKHAKEEEREKVLNEQATRYHTERMNRIIDEDKK